MISIIRSLSSLAESEPGARPSTASTCSCDVSKSPANIDTYREPVDSIDTSGDQEIIQADIEIEVLAAQLLASQQVDSFELLQIFRGGLTLRDPGIDEELPFGVRLAEQNLNELLRIDPLGKLAFRALDTDRAL